MTKKKLSTRQALAAAKRAIDATKTALAEEMEMLAEEIQTSETSGSTMAEQDAINTSFLSALSAAEKVLNEEEAVAERSAAAVAKDTVFIRDEINKALSLPAQPTLVDKDAEAWWAAMMMLYKYPYPAFMRNVRFVRIDHTTIREFPYRAVLPRPVMHPKLDGYRLCPNFPAVCVNVDGDVRAVNNPQMNPFVKRERKLDSLTITLELYGDYLLIPVPGRDKPQFVSRMQIYGDAWAAPTDNPTEKYNFAPRDGNYTHLTPTNIVRVMPWKKGKFKEWSEDSRSLVYSGVEDSWDLSKLLTAALKSNEMDFNAGEWCHLPFSYVASGLVSKRPSVTSIDWCFYYYWARYVSHWPEKELHPIVFAGTSWRELSVNSGIPVKMLKMLRKQGEKDGVTIKTI